MCKIVHDYSLFSFFLKVVPRLFYQQLTIFVHVDSHVLPGLHVLMSSKTEALYYAVFLSKYFLFEPSFAIGDFEIAPKNALVSTYPYITIIGCWCHFTKTVRLRKSAFQIISA